jgi:hypothetical protein
MMADTARNRAPSRRASNRRESLLAGIVADRDARLSRSVERLVRGEVIPYDDLDAVREAISNELMASGIDAATGSVIAHGVELDNLIDWVESLDRKARESEVNG